MTIDFNGIDRRTIALPMPARNYHLVVCGPEGTLFVGENVPNSQGLTIQKFTLKERKATPYVEGVSQVSVSSDGKKTTGKSWQFMENNGHRQSFR